MTDFIIGNYSNQQYVNSLSPETLDTQAFGYLNNFRITKYELWFTDTISFIPYSSPSVFIIDNTGNITHTGNLTTEKNTLIKGDLTTEKNSLTRGNTTVKGNSLFESNVVVNGTVRIGGDLYVGGQIFSDYLTGLLAGISGAATSAAAAAEAASAAASAAAAGAAPSTLESGVQQSPTTVTQNTTIVQQPIYDDVEIVFANPTDASRNSGTLRSISYNGIVANVQNGYQVGGMRTGKYVQDGKRVGIEMILTSNSSAGEFGDEEGILIEERGRRAGGGFTGTIRLTFPNAIREFSIKAVDNNRTGTGRYSAIIRYANNLTKQVNFIFNSFNSEFIVNEKTDAGAGDIIEVTLSNGVFNDQFGSAYITYTNLFWK